MSAGPDWYGEIFEVRLGPPGHGGFCVARHEGRVLFVRHGLPGELVRAQITEDRGGSFCRADAIDILEASPDRIPATCPVSGPGGAGCCDFTFATPAAQRDLKHQVVADQLRRLANWEPDFIVETIPTPLGLPSGVAAQLDALAARRPGTPDRRPPGPGRIGGVATHVARALTVGTDLGGARSADAYAGGWRSRVRLTVDSDGRAGVHGYRSTEVIADLRCPQPMAGAMDGIAERKWTPGADLVVAVDGDGMRHVVEVAPAADERGDRRGRGGDRRENGRGGGASGRRGGDRGSTAARRAAAHGPRA
ncbi:TRAM domain-containing protein, partial [Nocardia sp. NPDC004722]